MPYTRALLNSLPRAGQTTLDSIGGQPPNFADLPVGCAFGPRCPLKFSECSEEPTLLEVESLHSSACWKAKEVEALKSGESLDQLRVLAD